jgi:hypothetical protein
MPPNTSRRVIRAFNEFDNSLNLDRAERDRAITAHNEMSDILVKAGVAVSTFLQGSFARKTMLPPLKDVDIIVLLAATLDEVRRTPGSAKGAIAATRAAIAAARPDARFDVTSQAAHALQVCLPGCDFSIDLVPAVEDPNDGSVVWIADRENDKWERSTVRGLNQSIRNHNVACGGRFVHQVRMLKQARTTSRALKDVSGLAIETLAYRVISGEIDHPTGVASVLRSAAGLLAGPLLDPVGDQDLTAEWTSQERAAIIAAFVGLSSRAEEALELDASGDPEAAVESWGVVFGEAFPPARQQSAEEALAALQGGSTASTGRVTTSARPNAVAARPTRSWRS